MLELLSADRKKEKEGGGGGVKIKAVNYSETILSFPAYPRTKFPYVPVIVSRAIKVKPCDRFVIYIGTVFFSFTKTFIEWPTLLPPQLRAILCIHI